jgi:hypothetical protein
MAKRNQELTRELEALVAAHEELKAEQEQWRAEQSARAKEAAEAKEAVEAREAARAKEGFKSREEGLHSKAEACLSQMLGAGGGGEEVDGGKFGEFMVKVVVCKRCFGPQTKAKCED